MGSQFCDSSNKWDNLSMIMTMKLYFYVQRRNSEMKRGISSLFKTKILLESSTKFTSAKNS